MSFGSRLLEARKRRGLSQFLGTKGPVIGRDERDEVKPSVEVVIKIADALGVSLDFLVGKTSMELDSDALKRLEEISALPDDEKSKLYMVVDALLRDFKAKQAYS
ncbi:helix-turn-helix domain-containing protein [Roseivirga sp.]|uniref:helix-turn-helix domain-containing protein n=1 Tax=Roseivirga sp. TaxID=1964215 RepID=UPI003B5219F1